MTDPLVGRRIAQYDIVSRVGGGAMGVVYKAHDSKLGRAVALKFLPPQWSHDESAKQRFLREAQAASATNHPNICTIHDIETADDGQLFIVMAYYEGRTLKQRLESGPMSIDEALDIATQIADGLAKAHAQGVVHRDIKPGNIILTDDGVRILDFGLATFADALKLTAEHATLGTSAYMSPEQVRGLAADARSDVWATGVVLYEMIAGHPPFQGTYHEALAHAIRHEAPVALRTIRPDVSEDVERLVFRAMHKEASIRYESGRELARALRQTRGFSVPLDLRTEPVVVTPDHVPSPRPRPWRRIVLAVGAVAALLLIAGVLVARVPVTRVRVAVAPFANQTGDTELDPFRLALTQSLTLALRDAPGLAVTPYGRVVESLSGLMASGSDPSNRDGLSAIAAQSASSLVVVPTLLRDGGAWRARVELWNASTATSDWTYETQPIVSSLNKDVAYRLALGLAGSIEEHLESGTSRFVRPVLAAVGAGKSAASGHVRSLDAARSFEDGTRWYESLEYAAARRAFEQAAERDPRNPLVLAWLARTQQLTRQDDNAHDAAARAVAAVTGEMPDVDSQLVRAIAAEVNRDFVAAETTYRKLVTLAPLDTSWAIELGAFLDRRGRTADAVGVYHDVLRTDARLVRPHLELCRLYSPSRLNESSNAKAEGMKAIEQYKAMGFRGGEGVSLLCLADTLRVGSDQDRAEARRNADTARTIFEQIGFGYNQARAGYYLALVAGMEGRYAESITLGEGALTQAKAADNVPVQPLILLNLGSAQLSFGQPSQAAGSYQQASRLYQDWREEARAAQIQANRGSMLIDYGNGVEGVRDVQNALAVLERENDHDYQVFCLRVLATHLRNQGRYEAADAELHKAQAIASQWKLTDKLTQVSTQLAQSRFDINDYGAALQLQTDALAQGTAVRDVETRIRLARTKTRLGDLPGADADLKTAEMQLAASPSDVLNPLLALVRGEWALESGDRRAAQTNFTRGAARAASSLPEPSALEARAYLGLLMAVEGSVDAGEAAVRESLKAAEALGRLALESRCRIFLAEIGVMRQKFGDAEAALKSIPPDGDGRVVGRELRAEVHYWDSKIRSARGDAEGAKTEASAARTVMNGLVRDVPERYRESLERRPSVRRIFD